MLNKDYFCQFSWVMKVLDSCENETQIETSRKLFELYINKWKNEINQKEINLFTNHFDKGIKNKSLKSKNKKEGFLSKFSQFFLL
jgi:hypothetical protein